MRKNAIRLSVVILSAFTLISFLRIGLSVAEEAKKGGPQLIDLLDKEKCPEGEVRYKGDCLPKATRDDFVALDKKLKEQQISKDIPDEKQCKDAEKAAIEQQTKLNKVCGSYGYNGKTCIQNVKNCAACRNESNSDEDSDNNSDTDKDSDDDIGDECEDEDLFEEALAAMEKGDFGRAAKPQTSETVKLEAKYKNYQACPLLLSDDLEKLEKQHDEAKKLNKEDGDKAEKLKEELGEIEAKIKQAQEDVQSEYTKIDNERQDALDEIKESAKEDTENLRKQYDQAGADIDRAIEDLDDAALSQEEAIKTAELECYNMSINQLNEFLKARKDAVAAGQLTTNGFSSLIGSTGKTRKQKNAQFAQERYISCLESKNFKTRKDTIKKRYNQTVERIKNQINGLYKKQGQLVLDMGGDKMKEKYQTAITKISRKAETEGAAAMKKFNSERTKLLAEMQAKQSQLSKVNLEIQERNLELNALGQIFGFANKNKVRAAKNKDASDLESGVSDYLSAVEKARVDCSCDKTTYIATNKQLSGTCEVLKRMDPNVPTSPLHNSKRSNQTKK
jgi:hypothetical protein